MAVGHVAATWERVEIGQRIRIRTEDGGTLVGTFEGLSQGATLSIVTEGVSQSVPSDSIDRISIERRAWRKGMKGGLITGAILGGIGGAILVATALNFGDIDNEGEVGVGIVAGYFAVFMAIGATLGAGVGAGGGAPVGLVFTEWQEPIEWRVRGAQPRASEQGAQRDAGLELRSSATHASTRVTARDLEWAFAPFVINRHGHHDWGIALVTRF